MLDMNMCFREVCVCIMYIHDGVNDVCIDIILQMCK